MNEETKPASAMWSATDGFTEWIVAACSPRTVRRALAQRKTRGAITVSLCHRQSVCGHYPDGKVLFVTRAPRPA